MFGMHLGRMGSIGSLRTDAQKIMDLFSNNKQGTWYDPSDLSTLFQDSEGTVPVTAVEQPVGRILDKSGRGNHATQATTTKRPVLSARVNFIGTMDTRTLAGATLLKQGTGATPVITPGFTAPDGSNTAVRVQLDAGSGLSGADYSLVAANFSGAAQIAAPYKSEFWLKSNTGAPQYVVFVGAGSEMQAFTATPEWVKHTKNETGIAGGGFSFRLSVNGGIPATRGPQDILIWQPQLLAADSQLPYQWAAPGGSYDADPAKFPRYLKFDGVDDALMTGNIDFTGTDKMTVWAGIRQVSGTATQYITAINRTGNQRFALIATLSGFTQFESRGTTSAYAATANSEGVLTGIGDIGGDVSSIRVNGVQAASSASDQGTGNYSNAPLYIGSGDSTSLYLNARLYGLIVRGAQSSPPQIEIVERYLKQKMRMPL